MDILQIASLLVVLAALGGAANYLFLRLPSAIGILVVSLAASVLVIALDLVVPGLGLRDTVRGFVLEIAFSDALLEGMLGLLLFAGAMHVKLDALKSEGLVILLMATLGIALSTAVIGTGFTLLTGAPILMALLFGAIVSPTDPVAVLGVLRDANLPQSLETKVAGESLFNDGVGYVVYLLLVDLAFSQAGHGGEAGFGPAIQLFVQEALGGALLGVVLGYATFRIMRRIDDYSLEVLLTLALALGGYQLAVALHMSAPIMAVCAGLLIGDVGERHAMSETTATYVNGFWKLIDEILNAVLFLMIGVEVFAVAFDGQAVAVGLASVVLALVGRFAAVSIPITLLKPFREFDRGVTRIMTWGGLKGGISVALALSLPDGDWTPMILTATYIIVVFSIVVQGLSVGRLSKRWSD